MHTYVELPQMGFYLGRTKPKASFLKISVKPFANIIISGIIHISLIK